MEQRLNQIENRQDTLEATFKMYMQRQDERDQQMREELREMRARQEADMREMRTRHNELETKREQDRKDMYTLVDRLDSKIDGVMKHVQNLTVTVAIGIGAIIVSVVIFIHSTLSKGG